jgi:hypothetical protein
MRNMTEILRIERKNYFSRQKTTKISPGFYEMLYDPNKAITLTPKDYFKEIVVTDKGISVVKTDAELVSTITPFKIKFRMEKSDKAHVDNEYPHEVINKNERALSPTHPSREPFSIFTGHRIIYKSI